MFATTFDEILVINFLKHRNITLIRSCLRWCCSYDVLLQFYDYLCIISFIFHTVHVYESLLGNKARSTYSTYCLSICLRKYFVFMHNAVSKQTKCSRVESTKKKGMNLSGIVSSGEPNRQLESQYPNIPNP